MNGLGMLAGFQGFATGVPLGLQLVGADAESRKIEAEHAAAKARGLQDAFKTQIELHKMQQAQNNWEYEQKFKGAQYTDQVAHNISLEQGAAEDRAWKRGQDQFDNAIKAGAQGMASGRYNADMAEAGRKAAEFQRVQDFRNNRTKTSELVNMFLDPNQSMSKEQYDVLKQRFPSAYNSLSVPEPERHEQVFRTAAQAVASKQDPNAFNRPEVLASVNTIVNRDLNNTVGSKAYDGSKIVGVEAAKLGYDPAQPGTFSVGVRIKTDNGKSYDSWITPGRGVIGPQDLNKPPPAEAARFKGEQFVNAVRGLSLVSGVQRNPKVIEEMQDINRALQSADNPEDAWKELTRMQEARLDRTSKETTANRSASGDLRSQVKQVLSLNRPQDFDTHAAALLPDDDTGMKRAELARLERQYWSTLEEKAYDYVNQHPGADLEDVMAYARANTPASFESAQQIWTQGTSVPGGTVYSVPPQNNQAVGRVLAEFRQRAQGLDQNGAEFKKLYQEYHQRLTDMGVR